MTVVTIEIPDDIANRFESLDMLRRTLYEDFIIGQRQSGNLSFGEAAELLNITYPEFFELLGERGLTVINAEPGELESSYQRFVGIMRRQDA